MPGYKLRQVAALPTAGHRAPGPQAGHCLPTARVAATVSSSPLNSAARFSLRPKQSSRHSDFLLDKQTAAALSRAPRLITSRSWQQTNRAHGPWALGEVLIQGLRYLLKVHLAGVKNLLMGFYEPDCNSAQSSQQSANILGSLVVEMQTGKNQLEDYLFPLRVECLADRRTRQSTPRPVDTSLPGPNK